MFDPVLMERMKQARRIAVLTGAGISAESGVPTFRGEDGLWKKFRPEELANFEAFMRNPDLVWEWYNYRRTLIREVKPNPGHYALAKMEALVPQLWLITQNVDGLHRAAGSKNIFELHGNIMHSKCVSCNIKQDETVLFEKGTLPQCVCGGLMRPDVVWYGEMLPEDVLQEAFKAAGQCDVFLSIGTSALVQPAASLPLAAQERGAYVVEINKEPTVISTRVDASLLGLSGDLLPKLVQEVWDGK